MSISAKAVGVLAVTGAPPLWTPARAIPSLPDSIAPGSSPFRADVLPATQSGAGISHLSFAAPTPDRWTNNARCSQPQRRDRQLHLQIFRGGHQQLAACLSWRFLDWVAAGLTRESRRDFLSTHASLPRASRTSPRFPAIRIQPAPLSS